MENQSQKQIRKISELVEIGYPRQYLLEIYRSGAKINGDYCAFKGNKRNSPILFNVEILRKYQNQVEQRRLDSRLHGRRSG
jgi:hypothetical protein